jgi:hypothetical protein
MQTDDRLYDDTYGWQQAASTTEEKEFIMSCGVCNTVIFLLANYYYSLFLNVMHNIITSRVE